MNDYSDITTTFDLGTEFAEAVEAVKGLGWDEYLDAYSDRKWRVEAVPGAGGRALIDVLSEPTRVISVMGTMGSLMYFNAVVGDVTG